MSTITTRAGKGSPLTNNEVDANFTNLNTDKAELSGATFTGEITANGGIALGDNDKAIFGAGSDLQIYHDTLNSVIKDAGAGNLELLGNNLRLKNADASNSYLNGDNGGAVTIYHAGVQKFITTSTGIDVTGTATMDGLVLEASTSSYSTDATLSNYSASNGVYLNGNIGGWLRLNADRTGQQRLDLFGNNAGGSANLVTGNASRLNVANNGDISFYEDTGTTPKLFWDASAESLGIGTSSPQAALDVNGSYIRLDNGTYSVSMGQGNALISGQTPSDFVIGTNGSSDLVLATGGADRLHIDSSGNVGIGTDTPNVYGKTAIKGGKAGTANSNLSLLTNGDAQGEEANLAFYGTFVGTSDNGPRRTADITSGFEGGNWGTEYLSFNVGKSGSSNDTRVLTNERMRIDSSGNLLVGKSSAAFGTAGVELKSSGETYVTRASGTPLHVRRNTDDGGLVGFWKDGSTVGSIGTVSGDLFIDGGSEHTGLRFEGTDITPRHNGALSNGVNDLGASSARFKDLYLSGGVYLGGTGAANKLDDYEEGTFTPSYGGSSSDPTATYINQYGSYTKVGNTVCFTLEVRTSAISGGSGSLFVEGLPFTANARYFECAITMYYVTFNSAHSYTAEIPAGANHMLIRGSSSGGADSLLAVSSVLNVNPSLIRITGTYQTA